MPKSTTSKPGLAAHWSAQPVAVNRDKRWLTVETTRQPMSEHGASADDRGMFEWGDDYRDEHHASVRPPQTSPSCPMRQASATQSSGKVRLARGPGFTLTGDIDWRWPQYNYSNEDNANESQSTPCQYSPPIVPQKNRSESTANFATTNWGMDHQHKAFFETEESQISITKIPGRGAKVLPDWVHPIWDPFEDFRSSSPNFVATFEMVFRLVYPHTKYDITNDNVLVVEMAQRLAAKRSRIANTVMQNIKEFFEQAQYANHPAHVKDYVRWALLPDGPAFHETPTPITCKVGRGHEDYIKPEGTFQSSFISKPAKYFLCQVKGSVLSPAIGASNPPKGLYALLLVSVERAFTAFKSGSYMKPKIKFSHDKYHTQLETYLTHLDTVGQRSWERILCRVNASDSIAATEEEFAEASTMSDNRQNLFMDNVKEA